MYRLDSYLSLRISQKPNAKTSRNFLYMLMWPWLGLSLMQYKSEITAGAANTLCISGFVDDVMFLHIGVNNDVGAVLQQVIMNEFPLHFPGGRHHADFVVV